MGLSVAATTTSTTSKNSSSSLSLIKEEAPVVPHAAMMQAGAASAESIIADMVLERLMQDSDFFQKHKPKVLPTFERGEVQLGHLLGQGEFGFVNEVRGFRISLPEKEKEHDWLESQATKDMSLSQEETVPPTSVEEKEEQPQDNASDQEAVFVEKLKDLMARHPRRDNMARYAIKRPRDDVSAAERVNTVAALAVETEFLMRVAHPNIIKVRGTVGTRGTTSFRLVMDRLNQTLIDKIGDWAQLEKTMLRRKKKSMGGLGASLFGSNKKKQKKKSIEQSHCDFDLLMLLQDRLIAAYDVARALRHLHRLKLLFRDLKPENVGVDCRGDFRLFDFGLVRELRPCELEAAPDGYLLTIEAGTRRYMAPEVARGDLYGFSSDVYGFGLLLWQIFSGSLPYPKINNVDQLQKKVVEQGQRPPTLSTLSERSELAKLMKQSWDDSPASRPKIDEICQILQLEVIKAQEESGRADIVILDRSGCLMERSNHSIQARME